VTNSEDKGKQTAEDSSHLDTCLDPQNLLIASFLTNENAGQQLKFEVLVSKMSTNTCGKPDFLYPPNLGGRN
jgi:hypothetical protein